nr:PTS sugar transporter subunit IIC [Desulfovibrio aminophilus]
MVRRGRFFFVLLGLCRSSLNLGLIERPLAIGFLWSLFGGDWSTSLAVAVFYELFWLDAIPAGTYIPPHLAASTTAALALVSHFGLTHPAQIAVPLALSMPLSWLGARLEGALREWQNRGYSAILQWARHSADPDLPPRLVLRAVLTSALFSWLFFFSCILTLAVVTDLCLLRFGPQLAASRLTWTPLLLAAGLGGVLSLRLRRAQALFAAGAVVVILFSFAGVF